MYFGIMQGRLSMRRGTQLQSFPWETWDKEFIIAAKCQYDSIEWVFESDGFQHNPIWTTNGRKEILNLVKESGVAVKSLCGNYFMDNPLFGVSESDRKSNVLQFKELIKKASSVGVQTILLPLLEQSALTSSDDVDVLLSSLYECSADITNFGVKIGLETDLPAGVYLDLINALNSPLFGAYYDIGNAAYCGYNIIEDIEILRNVLLGIHIKDRKRAGQSVYLGDGDANLEMIIPFLMGLNYDNGLVFEHYYDESPVDTANWNLMYLKKIIGINSLKI